MQVFYASTPLQPYIKRYVLVSTGDEMRVNRLLPDNSVTLAFRLKGETSSIDGSQLNKLPASIITGLRNSARLIKYLSDSACLIVVFNASTAYNFFRNPIHELFNQSIPLQDVVTPYLVSDVEHSLQSASSFKDCVTIVEAFLLSRLTTSKPDALIVEAVTRITQKAGNIKIQDLAEDLCLSQDAFEKRFRKIIGSSPKHFAKTVRLRSVLNQKYPSNSITSIALDAGYFDSSHFNKDFKLFTGQNPKEFFQAPVFW